MNDLISRQAAIRIIKSRQWLTEGAKEVLIHQFKELPSFEPKRLTGNWIKYHDDGLILINGMRTGGVRCSVCGHKTMNMAHVMIGCPYKFCPHCGADMRGESDE